MNSTAVDVSAMLVADTSLGLTIATNLFVGKEPTTPDNCVTVIDSYGYSPLLSLGGKSEGTSYQYPAVQIRIRNRDYRTAINLAQNIHDSLNGRNQETWNGTLYTVIHATSSPALLTWDDNGLTHCVVNFNIQRR